MKRFLSFILCLALFIPQQVFAADIDTAIINTAAYVYKTTPSPAVGSVGGEWAVLGLARSGYEAPEECYDKYYSAVCGYVSEKNGVLSANKYTEYSRVIIALTATGKNPADIAGYNLLMPLGDFDGTCRQGLNGPVWALIALDSGSYAMPQNPEAKTQATRGMYIQEILSRQLADGGWALNRAAESSDIEITAMALQALAKYRIRADVNSAAERALGYISAAQSDDGGFDSSEACAQVLVALGELGISPFDERFIKNGNSVLDKLLSYQQTDGGFAHTGSEVNRMATEQALYALDSARLAQSRRSLYSASLNTGAVPEYIRLRTLLDTIKNER